MSGSFQGQEAIADILSQVKDVNELLFGVLIEILLKEQVQDCIGYLSDYRNQKYLESQILQQAENITQVDKQQKLAVIGNEMKQITDVLKKIKDHDFNYQDFSSFENEESTLSLIQSIKDNRRIIEFLLFLVQITSIDKTLIQCGSNSLHILVKTKEDLRNQKFEKIKIKNTSLEAANFARCNFSESQFNNVNISGINLNGALLFNCKWRNLKIPVLYKLDSDCVKSVCFSPDGNTLASGSNDQSIHLLDVKTGQYKTKLDVHRGTVWSVCFSPNGNSLASGSNDGSVLLWDVKTRKKRAELHAHTGTVYSVCFSNDGDKLASGSGDKSIRLWDVKTGQQKVKFDGHSDYVRSVCFSPDQNTLASGSDDKSIRLWDVKTGQQKAKLDGHFSYVYSVCFSPDGNKLASGSDDKSIRLWDVKTGQQKYKLDGHSDYVRSVCFSPDGNTLASGSDDDSIRLWDVKTGQQKAQLNGHSNLIMSVCFSPDGNTLASGSDDESILLWDVQNGNEISSAYKIYKDILAKYKAPLFLNNPKPESNNITILRISQTPLFQAQGALIFKGDFLNYDGYDLRPLFKSSGSSILEEFQQK
ncbi:unnamed protein product [Paramecium pentaurelia]|uniref:WD-40 repeat protein n=1 Tax=Paramecium pentaurelia TaxID=43138 RepID=A0A8S1Y348_9CILI|nr:unnamed protein product [Paramecium pentaurelia]